VCVFETILFAALYNSEGVVVRSGTGSMQFGTRRLRALQSEEAVSSDFELDFGVLACPSDYDKDSTTAMSGIMAATTIRKTIYAEERQGKHKTTTGQLLHTIHRVNGYNLEAIIL
jgi:hypothetical protein